MTNDQTTDRVIELSEFSHTELALHACAVEKERDAYREALIAARDFIEPLGPGTVLSQARAVLARYPR